MNTPLEHFGLRRNNDWLTSNNPSFRPPSWPPPRDWAVSESRDGKILSRWGDSTWDISPWAGRSMILDFGDGPTRRSPAIDPRNADLLRLLTTWRIWGTKACNSANGLKSKFLAIRRIFVLCSENGFRASDLMRFPRVLELIPKIIPPSEYATTLLELHRVWDSREHLGFYLADPSGIKRLSAVIPSREIEQTAYIPPRIWTYQVERLRSCIDDYILNKQAVEDCFHFCLDSYIQNFGSIESATSGGARHRLPFWTPKKDGYGSRVGCIYHGRFGLTAERFGISELLAKWISRPLSGWEIRSLSTYMSLVQYVGVAYIANFTLQRISEVFSLRNDCLLWESDEKLGRIPIICGETTKTEIDSDARWPTSPSVEAAIDAMRSISRLRMSCASKNPSMNPTEDEKNNPYLFSPTTEPWAGNRLQEYSIRINPGSYQSICKRYEHLFDKEKLRITDEDLRIARMLTPNLSESRGFAVGRVWPLAWHQLRRTGAVNMFSSGLLSDSSIQFQLKHTSRFMPLYYGRGYSQLLLNEEVERLVVNAMYESMAKKLLIADKDRFISPLGAERKETILTNLIGDKDAKALIAAGRRGEISFRETRVGVCTHRGVCDYGGIESISRCTGGDGYAPCADALYDSEKSVGVEHEITLIEQELQSCQADSPRHKALQAERKGLENYLNVVASRKP